MAIAPSHYMPNHGGQCWCHFAKINQQYTFSEKWQQCPSTVIGSAAVGNKIAIATIAINKMDTDSATCHQKTKLKYSDISILYK